MKYQKVKNNKDILPNMPLYTLCNEEYYRLNIPVEDISWFSGNLWYVALEEHMFDVKSKEAYWDLRLVQEREDPGILSSFNNPEELMQYKNPLLFELIFYVLRGIDLSSYRTSQFKI